MVTPRHARKTNVKNKGLLFLVLFFCFTPAVFSQTISGQVETPHFKTSADSVYVDSLIRLAWQNRYRKMKEAYVYAQTAYQTANQLNYTNGIIDAANYLGQQMRDWTNYPKALSYYFTGLQAAQQIADHRQVIRFYLLIGQLYDRKKEYPEALDWYGKAEKKATKSADSLYLAYTLGNKAIVMDKTGKLDEAYRLNLEVLKYLSNGVGSKMDSMNYYNNLALNQKRQHLYDNALAYLLNARRLMQHTTDTFLLTIWYNNMGSLLTAMKRFQQAGAKFDTALVLGEKVQSDYVNEDIFNNLGNYYTAKLDYKKALDWYKKSWALKDSIQQERKDRQFTTLRIQYDLGKKEAMLSAQSQELKQRRNLIIAVLAGLILLLLLAITLFISNRKRKNNNRLLMEKNKKISIQQEKLEEVNHVKDRLFSIISHDLKSPMQSLLFYLKLLHNKKLSRDEVSSLAGELEHHFNHTRNMADNLLYWASHQMKGWQLNPKNLVLSDILNEVLPTVAPNAERKNIVISNPENGEVNLFSDPEMLKLVLRNVLTNAVKFTPEGGRISIRIKDKGNKIRLSVSDTGVGMDEKMLERFRQGDALISRPGTADEKGTGLGILVSRQLLEKQGGEMKIESQPGHGTTVHIDFPVQVVCS